MDTCTVTTTVTATKVVLRGDLARAISSLISSSVASSVSSSVLAACTTTASPPASSLVLSAGQRLYDPSDPADSGVCSRGGVLPKLLVASSSASVLCWVAFWQYRDAWYGSVQTKEALAVLGTFTFLMNVVVGNVFLAFCLAAGGAEATEISVCVLGALSGAVTLASLYLKWFAQKKKTEKKEEEKKAAEPAVEPSSSDSSPESSSAAAAASSSLSSS